MFRVVTFAHSVVPDICFTWRWRIENNLPSGLLFLLWQGQRPGYSSTKDSLPPAIHYSTIVVQSSHFNKIFESPEMFLRSGQLSNDVHSYCLHVFFTRKGYFSIILRSISRKSSRVTEFHKLLRKITDLHVLL